ncbi:tyrosine-type recombinase/integrase [Halolamina litorea]|uniref:Tyrosine-type recombinase/integrase n=1 Tax=Halolamina litorea TaxID=1515593 RepID=A0ABD6BQU0_9EURY|nr:site-specific integrase [Halolamina litorea]
MSAADDSPIENVEQAANDDLTKLAEELVEKMSPSLSSMTSTPSLESMTPRDAIDKYFRTRNLPNGTANTHRSSLYNHFLVWCDEVRGIDDMSELTGSDIAEYRVWRREVAPTKVEKLAPKSEETQQKILRVFIKRCESWGVVAPNLRKYVIIPKLSRSDEVREEFLDSETAKHILDWLGRYEYASLHHVVWFLCAESGARLGGVHSLDVDDYVPEREGGYLKLRHRPETGTTLKNGEEGERNVSISSRLCEVLDDYLEDKRVDQTDDFDREPLLTTVHGRLSKSTIRNYFYAWTRPCATGSGCPYGRDPRECEGAQRNNWAFKCPDSLSTHPVRKGYITAELKGGVPQTVLSERCDVSEKILEKHYDHRTEQEKMQVRREMMKMSRKMGRGYGE